MSNSQGSSSGSRGSTSPGSGRTYQLVATHHQRKESLGSGGNGSDTKKRDPQAEQRQPPRVESARKAASKEHDPLPSQAPVSQEVIAGPSETRLPSSRVQAQQEIVQQQQRHLPSSSPSIGVHRSLSPKDISCAQSPNVQKSSEERTKDTSAPSSKTPKLVKTETFGKFRTEMTSPPASAKASKSGEELGAKSEVAQSSIQPVSGSTVFPSPESDSDSFGDKEVEDGGFSADYETLRGYEQVSKTILRKTDTAVKTSAEQAIRSKSARGEPIPESDGSRPSAGLEKGRAEATAAIPSSEIKKAKESEEAKSAGIELCRSTSPSHPIEERLTNTVIRRHVKGKPSISQEPKKRFVSTSENDSGTTIGRTERVSSTPSAKDSELASETVLEKHLEESKPKISPEKQSGQGDVPEKAKELPKEKKSPTSAVPKIQSQTVTSRAEKSSFPIVEVLVGSTERVPAKTPFVEKHGPIKKTKEPEAATPGTSKPKQPSPAEISSASTSSASVAKGTPKLASTEAVPQKGSEVAPSKPKRSFFWCKPKFPLLSKQAAVVEKPIELKSVAEEGSRRSENGIEYGDLPHHKHNKSCCFCWCCCCSCSCLSIRHNKRNQELKRQKRITAYLESYFMGEEQIPTLDDIRTWGESFDKLMKCSAGRRLFREFLQCEYSEENILFWLACEEFKRETRPEVIEEKARIIYEDFISILSPREVSLDSRVRDVINKNMMNPSTSTFDEAQMQIYTLMHRDSYPRFVNSPIYRRLAQLANSRRGSLI